MKNILLSIGLALLGSTAVTDSARAYEGAGSNLGFLPFGFYQPYGIRYSTSVRTPPYFSLNPPVYYGSRYARPYGASPFASPPLLTAPASYQAEQAAAFVRPIVTPIFNPYCIDELSAPGGEDPAELENTAILPEPVAGPADALQVSEPRVGEVRYNPFASVAELVGQPRPIAR